MIIVGIVLARLDSRRLPGKALRQVLGKPLIAYVIDRIRRVTGLDGFCIATTERQVDQPMVDYADEQNVPVFRGECDNVLRRFYEAAEYMGADYVVRLNGDSPFIDKGLLEQAIDLCRTGQYEFLTNIPGRTFPYGISIEIIKVSALRRVFSEQSLSAEHLEHVTKYFYDYPERFKICTITAQVPFRQDIRMVIDTPEDFELFSSVTSELGNSIDNASFETIYKGYLSLLKQEDNMEVIG